MKKFFSKVMLLLITVIFVLPVSGCSKEGMPYSGDYPEMPKAKMQATKLNLIDRSNVTEAEMLALITMQGVSANLTSEQIFFTDSAIQGNGEALDFIIEKNNVETETFTDAFTLMAKYKSYFNGYILCNLGTPSVNIATGFAGAKRAIAVDATIAAQVESELGLSVLKDFRGVTEHQLSYDYLRQEGINQILACEITYDVVNYLRDYAAMSSSLVIWVGIGDERTKVINNIGIPEEGFIVGYGDHSITGDESQFVKETSQLGINYVPCDWAMNASVLSGFDAELEKFTQIAPVSNAEYKEEAHRVVFLMSDGDNVQWNMNNVYNENWWGNSKRGEVPITWTISPRLYDMSPQHISIRYSTATENDYFSPYDSSLIFQSYYPGSALKRHVKRVNTDMAKMGSDVNTIIGFRGFLNDDVWNEYMAQPNVKGVLYNEFWGLENGVGAWQGAVQWVNKKPIVSCAYEYNRKKMNTTEELDALVSYVNSRPTDPSISDSYTLVYCNNWSTTPADLVYMAERFNDKVEVVNGAQLIDMMYHYNVRTPELEG